MNSADVATWISLAIGGTAVVAGGITYVQLRLDALRKEHTAKMDVISAKVDTISATAEARLEAVRTELNARIEVETSSLGAEMRTGFESVGDRINHIHEQLVRREDLGRVELQVRDTNLKIEKIGDNLTAVLLELARARPGARQ